MILKYIYSLTKHYSVITVAYVYSHETVKKLNIDFSTIYIQLINQYGHYRYRRLRAIH